MARKTTQEPLITVTEVMPISIESTFDTTIEELRTDVVGVLDESLIETKRIRTINEYILGQEVESPE